MTGFLMFFSIVFAVWAICCKVFKSDQHAPGILKLPVALPAALSAVMLLASLASLFNPFVTIGQTQVGVLKQWGRIASDDGLSPGLHTVIPVMQTVDIWDVSFTKTAGKSDASSRDVQRTTTEWALTWHLDPKAVVPLAKRSGKDFETTLIQPAVQESLKSVTAKFTAENLIAQREDVRSQVDALLNEKLSKYGIRIDQFAIMNFDFSRQFDSAVEAKQQAEQMALKAKNDLDRVKIEAEQKVAQAQAEADALRAQREQITPELLELRRVQVAQEAVAKWDGRLPTTNAGGALPFLDLVKK